MITTVIAYGVLGFPLGMNTPHAGHDSLMKKLDGDMEPGLVDLFKVWESGHGQEAWHARFSTTECAPVPHHFAPLFLFPSRSFNVSDMFPCIIFAES